MKKKKYLDDEPKRRRKADKLAGWSPPPDRWRYIPTPEKPPPAHDRAARKIKP